MEDIIRQRDALLLRIDQLERKLAKHFYPEETEKDQNDTPQETNSKIWTVPQYCVPINANVTTFDFSVTFACSKIIYTRLLLVAKGASKGMSI